MLFRFLIPLIMTQSVAFASCLFYEDIEQKIPVNDPNRLGCLKNSHFALPTPSSKSRDELIHGPSSSEPRLNTGERIHCRFFYRFQNGSSNKFRCYRTNEKNILYSDRGDLVPAAKEAANLTIQSKMQEAVLIDSAGQPIYSTGSNGTKKLLHADVLKIRFKSSLEEEKSISSFTEWRHREAFTSTVASRLAWVMGFASENYTPTKEVVCFGCDANPWNDGKNPQLKPSDKTKIFRFASIERKFEGKRIIKAYSSDPKKGKVFKNIPWTWYEYFSRFNRLSSQQQHELQVLALFISLLHTFEERGSQHVLLCEKQNISDNKRFCEKPLAGVHDLGSAFGNRDLRFIRNGNHPRGDYHAYRALNMFRDRECTLTAQPGRAAEDKGDGLLKKVSAAALNDFNSRLSLISFDDLITILQIANFQDADLPFKSEIRKSTGLSGHHLDEKVIEMWAELIQSKMEQFKSMRCPQNAVVL